MGVINSAKRALLNRMNRSAQVAGLGDLLNPCVVASGRRTTTGGSSTVNIPAPGVAVGDAVIVTVSVNGATPRTVTTAVAAADSITVVMSGDPSTDHVLNWVAFRSI